jgi:hypothetical protein
MLKLPILFFARHCECSEAIYFVYHSFLFHLFARLRPASADRLAQRKQPKKTLSIERDCFAALAMTPTKD